MVFGSKKQKPEKIHILAKSLSDVNDFNEKFNEVELDSGKAKYMTPL